MMTKVSYWGLTDPQHEGEASEKVQSLLAHPGIKVLQMEKMKVCCFLILKEEKAGDTQQYKAELVRGSDSDNHCTQHSRASVHISYLRVPMLYSIVQCVRSY